MNWISLHIMEILTFLLVCITGVYAFLTWRYVRLTKDILEENRLMRLGAQKPIIAIYLRSETTNHTSVYLCVENIGVGAAYSVEFDTDLSFRLDATRSLGGEVRILERGLRYFPPGKQREFRLSHGSYPEHNELMQRQLEIATAYKDSVDKEYDECFCLDFREH